MRCGAVLLRALRACLRLRLSLFLVGAKSAVPGQCRHVVFEIPCIVRLLLPLLLSGVHAFFAATPLICFCFVHCFNNCTVMVICNSVAVFSRHWPIDIPT